MSKKVIGIDLGGTTVKFAILSTEGKVQTKWSLPTDNSNEGKNIVPGIIDSINHHLNLYQMTPDDFIGIGMGSPGAVDMEAGTVFGAYNLNWKTTQYVKRDIEAGTGIPFFLENDANVAALGEQWQGAGEQNPDVVFVTLGTGVGGRVISRGKLLHGAGGAAGEIGHITVDPEGHLCACGKKGCLETIASATGVVRMAREMSEQFAGNSNLKYRIDDGELITAKDVFDASKKMDPFAVLVVDKITFYLGLACGNIGNMLNPAAIILGGGVSKAGDILQKKVTQYFREFAFPVVRDTTVIRIAELGNDAGVIGAASLVLQQDMKE